MQLLFGVSLSRLVTKDVMRQTVNFKITWLCGFDRGHLALVSDTFSMGLLKHHCGGKTDIGGVRGHPDRYALHPPRGVVPGWWSQDQKLLTEVEKYCWKHFRWNYWRELSNPPTRRKLGLMFKWNGGAITPSAYLGLTPQIPPQWMGIPPFPPTDIVRDAPCAASTHSMLE